ncbi:MAG: S1-like domain-containing RNA-binding protein [Candidatus Izemoplasmatales bacterium]
MMTIGDFNTLTVKRESDIAYILTDGVEEIFLHKKEALRPYLPEEKIDVFLYVDNVGRITASTKEPLTTIQKAAFLDVVSVNHQYGVFLDNHLVKDLLLSLDDLPLQLDLWPKPGDKMFVSMKEKKQHLYARILGKKQIAPYFQHMEKDDLVVGQTYDAYIQYILDDGYLAFTLVGEEIYISFTQCRKEYHLGELVQVKILKMNAHHEYTGSMIEQKEKMLNSDGEKLVAYMVNHGGEMRYTDKSAAEEIAFAFSMSKGAFKRALGSLYKAGKVELSETKTILKK